MPKIPVYDEPQVRERPLPAVPLRYSADPQAFGAGVGRAVQGAALVANKIFLQERERQDKARVRTAYAGFLTETNKYLQENLYTQIGENALGAVKPFQQWYEKRRSEVVKDFSERQKELFESREQVYRTRVTDRVTRYASAHAQRARIQGMQAEVEALQGDAVNDLGDPSELRMALEQTAGELGLDERAAKRYAATSISSVHEGRIERLQSEGEDLAAAAYFSEHKDELLADARTRLGGKLAKTSARAKAQGLADEILAQHPENESQALEQAYAVDDPAIRDDVHNRVAARFAERRRLARQRHEAAVDQAEDWVAERGSLDGLPGDVYGELDPDEINTLRQHGRNLRDGTQPLTDYGLWTELMDKSPQDLAEVSPLKYRGRLDDAHYDRLLGLRSSAKALLARADAAAAKPLKDLLTLKDQVKLSLTQSGIGDAGQAVSSWGAKDRERYGLFLSRAAERMKEEAERAGRNLSDTERQEIIDQMLINKVWVDTWGPDERYIVSALPDDKLQGAYVTEKDFTAPERDALWAITAVATGKSDPSDKEILAVGLDYRLGRNNTGSAMNDLASIRERFVALRRQPTPRALADAFRAYLSDDRAGVDQAIAGAPILREDQEALQKALVAVRNRYRNQLGQESGAHFAAALEAYVRGDMKAVDELILQDLEPN